MATEKRLIDANELETVFRETRISSVFSNWRNMDILAKCAVIEYAKEVKRIVTDAPTVDAVEVVHGRWIPSKSMALSDKCSVCHGWVTRHSVNERKFNYCPNCGAKMDGLEGS